MEVEAEDVIFSIFIALVLCLIGYFLFIALPAAMQAERTFQAKCDERGGLVFKDACVRKDAFIELKK